MMTMRYRLLAIDLDGTLLDPEGEVREIDAEALHRAQAAGCVVVPCTGRGWRESAYALRGVTGLAGEGGERGEGGKAGVGVFNTGAVVAELDSGRSVDLAVVEAGLAAELVAFLWDEPEAVLVYRDAERAGHDYLVTGIGELPENARWWFELTGALVHEQRGPWHGKELHHVLRVGLVAGGERVAAVRARVAGAFGERVLVHSFEALHRPDPRESVHVLEVFAAGVDKWRGVMWVARMLGVEAHEIAAIGDERNDLSMLRAAACGVAMANAAEEVKACANRVTRGNDEGGVAYAVERMLAGEW